jgi:hypothetical protein
MIYIKGTSSVRHFVSLLWPKFVPYINQKNMKNLFVILIALTIKANAQYVYQFPPRTQTNFDVVFAGGKKGFSPSASYTKIYGINENKRFKIGYGVRLNTYFAKNKEFITAPAKITSGKESFLALVSKPIIGNLDTLQMARTQTNAINTKFIIQYTIKRMDLGFNIDLFGLTLGGSQEGIFSAKESRLFNQTKQKARPSAFNLLLVGDSDRGSLNSEIYARYWVNDRIGIRAGASYQFFEYKTNNKLTFDNDRFRLKTIMPFVAVSFSTFNMVTKDLARKKRNK